MSDLASLAEILDRAAHERVATPQLTRARHELKVEDAYEIQRLSIDRRLQRGERRVGDKMGITSRAEMQEEGVDKTAWGRNTAKLLNEERLEERRAGNKWVCRKRSGRARYNTKK